MRRRPASDSPSPAASLIASVGGQQGGLQPQQGPHRAPPLGQWQRRERQHGTADGERRRSRERDDPVVAGEQAGGGQAVHRQQRGHAREGGADEHGARIAATCSDHGQGDRGARGEPGADRDRQEMDLGTDLDLLRPEEVQYAGGDDGAGGDDNEQGKVAFTHQGVHTSVIDAQRPGLNRVSVQASVCSPVKSGAAVLCWGP